MSLRHFTSNSTWIATIRLDHIVFPLQGIPVIRDTIPLDINSFSWKKEEWVLHKPFDLSTGSFEREMFLYGEELVVEKIQARQAGFGMERRFAKLQGDWYLIYYAAMNRL